jgi:hypothetical protein
MGRGFAYIDGNHIDADRMPAAHRDGVYGYGEPDPATPFYRPFQSAATVAAYRQQFDTEPTGVSATNHELNARQRANHEARAAEAARVRTNMTEVDYGTGHREGPGGPARPYVPTERREEFAAMRDGRLRQRIQDYALNAEDRAERNDHVRDGRNEEDFPPVLGRGEYHNVVSEINRLKRRRGYQRAKLQETRKAMHEELAQKEAEGFFGRHFRY